MIVPNSAFSISIIENNFKASLISILFAKIYLLLYSIIEFPEYYIEKFNCCSKSLNKYFPTT
jgi:hypothetical protein